MTPRNKDASGLGLVGSPGNSLGGLPSASASFRSGSGGGGIGYDKISTLTPEQQAILRGIMGQIEQGQQPLYGGQGQDMGSALQNALTSNPSAQISPEATAKWIKNSVATPLLRQYDQSIMPRLADSYASVGALMGSRRGLANQNALEALQSTVGKQLGEAQLSNMQLSAQLAQQTAQRQAQTVQGQQQTALGYGQLGANLTGQSHMAIQPYRKGSSFSGSASSGMNFGGNLLDFSGVSGPAMGNISGGNGRRTTNSASGGTSTPRSTGNFTMPSNSGYGMDDAASYLQENYGGFLGGQGAPEKYNASGMPLDYPQSNGYNLPNSNSSFIGNAIFENLLNGF